MVSAARKAFNEQFSAEKYQDFLTCLHQDLKDEVAFRVAETPVFLSQELKDKLVLAGDEILKTLLEPGFKKLTDRSIPKKWKVANETNHPHFIAFDFAICKDQQGELIPKLIELQGFPSLYGFQSFLADCYQQAYDLPADWDIYFSGLNKASYLELFKETIIGPYQPKEVVLMDVDAHQQKTSVDFLITQKYLGIPIVSLEDLKQEGKQLYYLADDQKVFIKRIYNRLIFDEIDTDPAIFDKVVDIRQDLDVEWITHPEWFYRISKFTMPFLHSKFIPKTWFLNELPSIPANLENYVLKPLFSFAGQGVIIDVKEADIHTITDPENWVLQEKVIYEPVVQAPDDGVKCEIRILYLWPEEDKQPTLAINLARLSRGKMIGVRYNKDFNWVGGTVAFFPK
ncbi:hypothetical protein [Mucilaginibacter arboris]|uniref:Circularly permuted type 2 ATP-grasp protein n=1 Tax=Mucilaginibacter arboris TaxID=2682090 RepID=A0A7K1SRY0_9SPHI|nr:hypothetical protein [Mucilaginibacter arboris]MVN20014.1 hypothetical protein [Mucilaginibacter arboris]